MLSLAAFGGLRVAEIAGLDRDDIIEAKGLVRVRHGKGDKERIVPLHPDVLTALRVLPMPRCGPIFVRPHGGKFPPNRLGVVVARYLRDLSIDATAHQLRHWFATSVYAATHDIRVTQEFLGRSRPLDHGRLHWRRRGSDAESSVFTLPAVIGALLPCLGVHRVFRAFGPRSSGASWGQSFGLLREFGLGALETGVEQCDRAVDQLPVLGGGVARPWRTFARPRRRTASSACLRRYGVRAASAICSAWVLSWSTDDFELVDSSVRSSPSLCRGSRWLASEFSGRRTSCASCRDLLEDGCDRLVDAFYCFE